MSERLQALCAWLARTTNNTAAGLVPAAEDASPRRYFRATVGAQTRIVMDAHPAQVDNANFVRIASLLREAGVNAPRVLASDEDAGFYLLSDLGTRRYFDVLDEDSVERLYADAIGALLSMQVSADARALPAYDDALLGGEMALFEDWFLERHLGLTLDPAQHRALHGVLALLSRSAREQPQVFVHRDYHSANLMLCDDHNPGVLDFQDAVRGPLTYDLVSLLKDVYVEWPPNRVDAWVETYRLLAIQHGVLADDEPRRFRRWFDWMGAQRHLKIAGIFARLCHRDAKRAYLAHIPLTLRYLSDACAAYAELAPLGELMQTLALCERLGDKR